MPNRNRVPKFPLDIIIASQPLCRSISGKVPTDNKQSRQPRQAPSCFLYYSTSSLIVLPSSSHPDSLFTNPNDPTCPPAKFPIQKVRIKLSHAPFLPLVRHFACKLDPSDTVEIFSSCTTFALSLSLFITTVTFLRNHLSFTKPQHTYPGVDHLLRQTSLCPTQLPTWVKLPSTATCQNLTPSL